MPLVPGWVGGGRGGISDAQSKTSCCIYPTCMEMRICRFRAAQESEFFPAGYQSATSNLLRLLNVPSGEKEGKDSVLQFIHIHTA